MRKPSILVLPIVGLLAIGCGAPIAVRELSPREAETAQQSFGLTTGTPSDFSEIVLRRYDLQSRFPHDPAGALAELHSIALKDDARPDELFALAELSYLHAASRGGRPYYLAAAIYAYALLFPGRDGERLDGIDPRRRMAADIYARALLGAFRSREQRGLQLAGGTYELPFGRIDISFDPASLQLKRGRFTELRPASNIEIRGLRNRYRKAGIGAAIVAHVSSPPGSLLEKYTSPALRIPATLLLEIDAPRQALAQTELRAKLEFRPFSVDETLTLEGNPTPVESEPSVALAMTLAESRFWKEELNNFLGRVLNVSSASKLQLAEPPRPGQIPVVFVHGTGSSPARWADMINDLSSDRRIHEHFTFWAFSYTSSRPIALSASQLRSQLTDAVHILDPEGVNPCIQDMVVIGHSQGGLLTKMTAIDSGDRFWRSLSDTPFESAPMSSDTRRIVREALFVKPLPFVKRLIFIATPHRGSYLAGPQIIRRIIQRLVALPVDLVKTGAEIGAAVVGGQASSECAVALERMPTSIDNMSPSSPFIKTLATIPIAPDVTANSIIPVIGDGPIEEGADGVVKYKSAHIDGVESELVVNSPHSVQSNPHAIEEVRRILLEHVEQSSCTPSTPAATPGAKP